MLSVAGVTFLAGLLFGYDQGVISGALPLVTADLGLTVVAGAFFTAGAILEALAPDATVLTVGRVITGLGVGFASVVAPLYAAEMAPRRLRGRFVSSYQLAITVGIFVAYLADDALTGSVQELWAPDQPAPARSST